MMSVRQVLRWGAVFKAEDGGHQVALRGQFTVAVGLFVNQEIFELGLELADQAGHRDDELTDVLGCAPGVAAIVEHDGQYRRQLASVQGVAVFDEVLVEQAQVDHDPQGHIFINAALKFDEEVEIEPVATHLDPPDEVVVAAAEVVADVFGGQLFQCAVVQAVQPVVWDEAGDEFLYQPWMTEEVFVAAVVFGHGFDFSGFTIGGLHNVILGPVHR